MQYMTLSPSGREELLKSLDRMPDWLRDTFSSLSPEQARERAAPDSFAPVEQVWHLADLEREGFGVRIRRLLSESEPQLAGFDGALIAEQRNYRSLSLTDGLVAFTAARRHNVDTLRRVPDDSWTRGGRQEGVGPVSLCDIPGQMSQHDAAHRSEIEEWLRRRGG